MWALENIVHLLYLFPCAQAGIYAWLLGSYVVYMLIAMYLDKVLPDTNGQRLHPLFFLQPSFWNPKYHNPEDNSSKVAASAGSVAPAPHSPMISSFTTPLDSPPLTPGQPRGMPTFQSPLAGCSPKLVTESTLLCSPPQSHPCSCTNTLVCLLQCSCTLLLYPLNAQTRRG